MSAAEVLAQHQWEFDNRYFCTCRTEIDYSLEAERNWTGCISASPSEQAMAAHQRDALKAAGYAVVDADRYRVALKAFTDLTEAWAELRMDTDKDQALHDRLVSASRTGAALLAADQVTP